MDNLIWKSMSEINLKDKFFDQLRNNYNHFNEWFKKKADADEKVLTYYKGDNLLDFLYLKKEEEPLEMEEQTLPKTKRLKVGTFKIERRGTNRGERFMKKILDIAVQREYSEVYVTMFDDTEDLLHLRHFFEKYGFKEVGHKAHSNKRKEVVLLREMSKPTKNIIQDFPLVNLSNGKKYVLSIYPTFHTKLFSDSILNKESINIIQDVSETNSIYKIYICWIHDVGSLQRGDNLIIYRTNDGFGPAYYRSVATSLCTVVETRSNRDFGNVESFITYCNKYSVFEEDALRRWFYGKTCYVIKMLYNIAFSNKVIRKDMIEKVGIPTDMYWGFYRITDDQCEELLKLGNVNERYIIH